MSEFTIRKENKPTRCEICHQSDMFESSLGECQRCKGVATPIEKNSLLQNSPIIMTNRHIDFMALSATFLGLLAFIPGLFFPPLGVFLGGMAWVAGVRALKHIDSQRGVLTGKSFAYIGVYCGTLGAILGFLLFLFVLRHYYF